MKTEIYHCCKLQLHCKVKIIFDNYKKIFYFTLQITIPMFMFSFI